MSLTAKQEKFCIEYISAGPDKNGSASDAYRAAYSTKKMSDAAIHVEAGRLLKNPKIALRLDELRAPVVEQAQMTLKGHLDRLEHLSVQAEKDGKWDAAITAEVNRGKASGLYVAKHEVKTDGPPAVHITLNKS